MYQSQQPFAVKKLVSDRSRAGNKMEMQVNLDSARVEPNRTETAAPDQSQPNYKNASEGAPTHTQEDHDLSPKGQLLGSVRQESALPDSAMPASAFQAQQK